MNSTIYAQISSNADILKSVSLLVREECLKTTLIRYMYHFLLIDLDSGFDKSIAANRTARKYFFSATNRTVIKTIVPDKRSVNFF